MLKQLQDVVISLHKAGNSDDLTVKRVRTRAEEALGLEAGFFNNPEWKQKSKDTIVEAVVSSLSIFVLADMSDTIAGEILRRRA